MGLFLFVKIYRSVYFCSVSKAQRTRQYIIEKTAPVFNRQGFTGTSLSDLTRTTGLTKGSIYGNFRDKEEIAREAFLYAIEKIRNTSRSRMAAQTTAKHKLLALFSFFEEYVLSPPVEGGCPLLNNAVEADDSHASMRGLVVQELQRSVALVKSLLDTGIQQGEFESDFDSEELSFLFFCAIEGAIMYSRVSQSGKAMEMVTRYIGQTIKQISKKQT